MQSAFWAVSTTLLAHAQLFISENIQTLCCRTDLNDFFQSILISVIALNQVQHFALGLAEFQEVLMGHFFSLSRSPWK